MTFSMVNGPKQSASNLGEGRSVTKSVESSHTWSPCFRVGTAWCFLLYCMACLFWAWSSHSLQRVWSLVSRASRNGMSLPRVGPSPVNVMSYPLFDLNGDMPIDG